MGLVLLFYGQGIPRFRVWAFEREPTAHARRSPRKTLGPPRNAPAFLFFLLPFFFFALCLHSVPRCSVLLGFNSVTAVPILLSPDNYGTQPEAVPQPPDGRTIVYSWPMNGSLGLHYKRNELKIEACSEEVNENPIFGGAFLILHSQTRRALFCGVQDLLVVQVRCLIAFSSSHRCDCLASDDATVFMLV